MSSGSIVYGKDAGGNCRPLRVNASGELTTAASGGADATEATLAAQSAKLPATLGQKTMANSMAVTLASDQSLLPASLGQKTMANSMAVTLASDQSLLPATLGQKTMANSMAVTLASDQSLLPASLGQKTMANSMAVTLASDQSTLTVSQGGTTSTDNTTTTLLGATATYTGTWELNSLADVMVSCTSVTAGTLYFDFSIDGTNVSTFPTAGFTVAAGIHEFHTAVKGPRYFRVRFVNGDTTQVGGYFRLTTYYGTFRLGNAPLNQSIGADSDAVITRSVVVGVNDAGTYNNVTITNQNELLVNTLASNRMKRVVYANASVTGDLYLMLIDLSDTTLWKHTLTTGIVIMFIDMNLNYTANGGKSNARIGVITRVDDTNCDVSYLIDESGAVQTSNNGVHFDQNFSPGGISFLVTAGALVHAATNIKDTNTESIQTDVALATCLGGTAMPAVGDIILNLTHPTSDYSFNLGVSYYSV